MECSTVWGIHRDGATHFQQRRCGVARAKPKGIAESCFSITNYSITQSLNSLLIAEELVLFDDGGNPHLTRSCLLVHAYHASFTFHADALRQRDLGRQSQSEVQF